MKTVDRKEMEWFIQLKKEISASKLGRLSLKEVRDLYASIKNPKAPEVPKDVITEVNDTPISTLVAVLEITNAS